jgi:hypothetical protein
MPELRTLTRADAARPLPERLRIRAEYAGTWIGLQVLPPGLLAWILRKRCQARRRQLRKKEIRRAARN